MLDWKELKKIEKEKEDYKKKLKRLNKKKEKIEAELTKIRPVTVIPTEFRSDYGGYELDPNTLIGGRISTRNLPLNTPFNMTCPANYNGEMKDGLASCNLGPNIVIKQNDLIEVNQEIVKCQVKLDDLNKFEDYLLNQQRICEWNPDSKLEG